MAFKPSFKPTPDAPESPSVQKLIDTLNLQTHIEGGYFIETDRAPETVPSPFENTSPATAPQRPGFDPAVRNFSTTIFYLLTPKSPQGGFHRNKARTVHTLHKGRGRYIIIHANEDNRIESFIVGQDVSKGERLQWIVEGGKYKSSYLLPDEESGDSSEGLLISETVVPGFEYGDHDFLTGEKLVQLVGKEKADDLKWILSPLATGLNA